MHRLAAALALAVAVSSSAVAQESTNPPLDRLRFDLAGGMSRYGPQTFGALEVAMNRWLALRSDALFSLQQRENWPAFRYAALSVTSVLTLPRESRVTPYLFGGYGVSLSRFYQAGLNPLGGAGLRVRVGRFQPFLEARAQRGLGVPVSFGIRF